MNRRLELHVINHGCASSQCCRAASHSNGVDNDLSHGDAVLRPENPVFRRTKKQKKRKQLNFSIGSGRQETVLGFLRNALGKSSISGINYIALSKNRISQTIWILVVVVCFIGFGYQALRFARVYNNRPTIVQTQIENDGDTEFPSITVCNANRIRKSVYCQHFPEKCNSSAQKTCATEYCTQTVTVTQAEITDIMYELLKANHSEMKKDFGHSSSMIQSCFYNGMPRVSEEECINNLRFLYDPDFGNCFRIPNVNSKGEVLQASEADFWKEENDLSILLNTEAEEFTEAKRVPAVFVTIHSAKTFPDIHTEGVAIEAGHAYSLAIQRDVGVAVEANWCGHPVVTCKTTVRYLPLPYKTNCTDFYKLPWSRSEGRITSRMCTVGCSQYQQLTKCGFVTRELSLFYEQLPWNPKDITDEQRKCAKEEEERTKSYCRELCGVPCSDTQYSVAIGVNDLAKKEVEEFTKRSWRNKTWQETKENLAYVRVYFRTLEHRIFQHTPKYDTLELFSYMGGYSGVWLGFSLLTVYELIEILVATLQFAVTKYRDGLKKKQFVDAVIQSIINSGSGNKVHVKVGSNRKRTLR